jgi:hypothetical protein
MNILSYEVSTQRGQGQSSRAHGSRDYPQHEQDHEDDEPNHGVTLGLASGVRMMDEAVLDHSLWGASPVLENVGL